MYKKGTEMGLHYLRSIKTILKNYCDTTLLKSIRLIRKNLKLVLVCVFMCMFVLVCLLQVTGIIHVLSEVLWVSPFSPLLKTDGI